jgi:hypothetical protein
MLFSLNARYTAFAQEQSPSPQAVYSDDSNEYIVEKYQLLSHRAFAFRLAIKREDKSTIRSWRILQDIKNAIAGEDSAAIEVYPPESEVTDTANMYHLWVFKPGFGPGVSLVPPGTDGSP